LLKAHQRGSTNSSSNHAPLTTTITSDPSSTKGLAPSARIISNTERAAPANSKVLANRKERIRRVTTFPFRTVVSG